MRYLSELVAPAHVSQATVEQWQELPIVGVTANSRDVHPGMLFVAIPGTQFDGRKYIPEAIRCGAAAIVTTNLPEDMPVPTVPVLHVDNPRHALAMAASRFAGMQPECIVAVTGTDGKTSVAHFFQQLWHLMGHQAASIGTLGVAGVELKDHPALNTTPDPVLLHQTLSKMAADGVQHVAMEASSHGLDQHRLDGVALQAAGFTNLTRDHLDYHKTEEAYFNAKARLFGEVLPGGKTAVINADDPSASKLKTICDRMGHRTLMFGEAAEKSMHLRSLDARPDGQVMQLSLMGDDVEVTLPLIGRFQAMNVLCAMGLAHACGAGWEDMLAVLPKLHGVPGRMQRAAVSGSGAAVYVDYAHTPAGLESVLTHLRPHVQNRLHVVFGCGGDRDRGKRPLMGQAACKLADVVIVTDDNPRTENPELIRKDVMGGCTERAREIAGRREAIRAAVQDLQEGDVLLVAGKGHERTQIIGKEALPFDDVAEAKMAVGSAGARSAEQSRGLTDDEGTMDSR